MKIKKIQAVVGKPEDMFLNWDCYAQKHNIKTHVAGNQITLYCEPVEGLYCPSKATLRFIWEM